MDRIDIYYIIYFSPGISRNETKCVEFPNGVVLRVILVGRKKRDTWGVFFLTSANMVDYTILVPCGYLHPFIPANRYRWLVREYKRS